MDHYGDFALRLTGQSNVSSAARTDLDAGYHWQDQAGSGAGYDSLDW